MVQLPLTAGCQFQAFSRAKARRVKRRRGVETDAPDDRQQAIRSTKRLGRTRFMMPGVSRCARVPLESFKGCLARPRHVPMTSRRSSPNRNQEPQQSNDQSNGRSIWRLRAHRAEQAGWESSTPGLAAPLHKVATFPLATSLCSNRHRDRGAAGAHLPRFRALALLGRLPSVRVDRGVIQASEKPTQFLSSLSVRRRKRSLRSGVIVVKYDEKIDVHTHEPVGSVIPANHRIEAVSPTGMDDYDILASHSER
jgi:hypothetical protein